MKTFSYILLVIAVLLTVLADLLAAEIIYVEGGESVLFLGLLAGLAWLLTCCLGPRWIVLVAMINAPLHALFWFIAASVDNRTFYGGAMMRIISFWAWLIVTVALLFYIVVRWLRRSKSK